MSNKTAAVYYKDEDFWIVTLGNRASGYGDQYRYIINGTAVPDSNRIVTVKGKELKVQLSKKRTCVRGYENLDTHDVITVDEYNNFINSCKDADGNWKSLDDEYAGRKFITKHTQVYSTVYDLEDELIESAYMKECTLQSESKYITPMYIIGDLDENKNKEIYHSYMQTPVEGFLFSFDKAQFVYDYAIECLEKYKFKKITKEKYCDDKHCDKLNYKYYIINGMYDYTVMSTSFDEYFIRVKDDMNDHKPIIGTYEHLCEVMEACRKKIHDRIKRANDLFNVSTMKQMDIVDMIKTLRTINSNVQSKKFNKSDAMRMLYEVEHTLTKKLSKYWLNRLNATEPIED